MTFFVGEFEFGHVELGTLPEGVDRDEIDASFSAGVLTLTLPKTAEAVKQQKKIEARAK